VGPVTLAPVGPVGPVTEAPVGPVGPATVDAAPVGPVGPVTDAPVGPVGPVGPAAVLAAPVGPVGPVGPATVDAAPVGPVGPVTLAPVGPVGPVTDEPFAPVGPVGPGTVESDPVGPVGPVTELPVGPVGPVVEAPVGPVGPVVDAPVGPVGPVAAEAEPLAVMTPAASAKVTVALSWKVTASRFSVLPPAVVRTPGVGTVSQTFLWRLANHSSLDGNDAGHLSDVFGGGFSLIFKLLDAGIQGGIVNPQSPVISLKLRNSFPWPNLSHGPCLITSDHPVTMSPSHNP